MGAFVFRSSAGRVFAALGIVGGRIHFPSVVGSRFRRARDRRWARSFSDRVGGRVPGRARDRVGGRVAVGAPPARVARALGCALVRPALTRARARSCVPQLLALLLGALEVLRRSLWNVLRVEVRPRERLDVSSREASSSKSRIPAVATHDSDASCHHHLTTTQLSHTPSRCSSENEHATNCGRFRATRHVMLDVAPAAGDADDDDDAEGDAGLSLCGRVISCCPSKRKVMTTVDRRATVAALHKTMSMMRDLDGVVSGEPAASVQLSRRRKKATRDRESSEGGASENMRP